MSVRAKFRCNSVGAVRKATHWLDGGGTEEVEVVDISLNAVTSGSDENKEFYANTPSGYITLQTVNLKAAEEFMQGKEYYIEFTPAQS